MKLANWYSLKRSTAPVFWLAVGIVAVLAAIGLGSALQERQAATLFGLPATWSYALLILPGLLFLLVEWVLNRMNRRER
ncbi:MAG: hypothetical protein KDJ80_13550 [Nitratireductor sp.]|nr:hypothetical protein [Nitratireductor sp.]